jgi:hypothetical protein
MLALSNKGSNAAKDSSTAQTSNVEKKTQSFGRKNYAEEALTKEEIMRSMGIVDPVIKESVYESMNSIDYRAKSKDEVRSDVVNELERQIDKLKYKRSKIQEVFLYIITYLLLMKRMQKAKFNR